MIDIHAKQNAIEATIDGEEYARLEKIADAMNRTSWSDTDNTALTVFKSFVWTWIEDYLGEPERLALDILDGIATADDRMGLAPEPEHSRRIAELRKAYVEVGLIQNRDDASN